MRSSTVSGCFTSRRSEEIRVADERVYAGRTLHETLAEPDSEYQSVTIESEAWGLKGRVDYLRYRDGGLVAYEHKRGRSKGDAAWDSDRLQIIAYCALLSEHLGRPVPRDASAITRITRRCGSPPIMLL